MSRPLTATVPEAGAGAATWARLLRAHAAGLLADVAAVELLITHRHWLTRSAFTARFVHPVTTDTGRQVGAWIDWPAAVAALTRGDLPCSTSEASVLRIAAALPLSLRDVLGGLDRANITAVTTAITNANGTRP